MDGNFALDAIITRAYHELGEDLAKLQVEDGSREVASLQGHIAGYKELVKIISEEFPVSPGWLGAVEINAKDEAELSDMTDEAIAELSADSMNLIKNSEAWAKVLLKIASKTAELKDTLFFNGHSTRDLDISQGMYHGMTIYEAFFRAIDNEVERREKAKKNKKEELPFDGDGPAGEPGNVEEAAEEEAEPGFNL